MYNDRWLVAIIAAVAFVVIGAGFVNSPREGAGFYQGLASSRALLAGPVVAFSLVMVLWTLTVGDPLERTAAWLVALLAAEAVGTSNQGAALGLGLVVVAVLLRPALTKNGSGPDPKLNP